jgi:uncharacterized protein YndB with AHSA1/START domain
VELNFLYSVEREFDAPAESVWNAWVEAQALESWYHPTNLQNVPGSVVSEVEIGGLWTVAVDVPENNFVAYFYGRYTAISVNKKIEHSMFYVESTAEFEARDESRPFHEVIVDFEERGDSTWVKFSQFGELPEGHAPRAQAGMESYFDSLAEFLKTQA